MTYLYRGWLRACGSLGMAWLCLAASSCGGSVEDDPASGGPIAQADLPAVFAAAACASLAPCCAAARFQYDEATCRARVGYIRRLLEFAGDGHEVYDPAAARRCVDAWAAAQQSCSPQGFNAANPWAACVQLIRGTQPLGAVCNTVADCAPSATNCARQGDGLARCAADFADVRHGRVGEACTGTCSGKCLYFASGVGLGPVVDCYREDGLACGPTQTCEPPAEVGQSCAAAECVVGAFCDAGTCVPGLTSGPCDKSRLCGAGYFCDGTACRAKLPDGSPCGSGECEHQCNLPLPPAGSSGLQPPPTGDAIGVCGPVSIATPESCGATP
jgi:hypothetical protein